MDWFSTLAIWIWVALGGATVAGGVWIARAPWRNLMRQAEEDSGARLLPSSWLRPPRIEFQDGDYRGRFSLRFEPQTSRTFWRFEVETVALAAHLSLRVQKVVLVQRFLQRNTADSAPKSYPMSGLRVVSSDDEHMRAILRHESVQQAFAAVFAAYPFLQHIDLDETGVLYCECPTRERGYQAGRQGVRLLLKLVQQLDAHRLSGRELSRHRQAHLKGLGAQSGRPVGVGSISPLDD